MGETHSTEEGRREVDLWRDTDEWRLALNLHNALCKSSHAMDACWGLALPYDLKQPRLSLIQREYLSRARELIRVTGGVAEAERIMFALAPNWPVPTHIDPPQSGESEGA